MPVKPKLSELSVEYRPLEKLIGYVRNARTHSDEQVAQIASSIREFGWTNPILVDGDDGVIAGHGRILAARKLGLKKVPVIELKHLTETQKKAYIIADNKLALNAGWDNALLAIELQDLQDANFDLSLTGFSSDEIEDIRDAADGEGEAEGDDAADEVPEVAETIIRTGDLWCLGDQRLLCGDSTNAADVARVMTGEKALLCFSSPPYGQQRDYTTGGIANWDALMQGVYKNLPMREDGQVLVNLGLIHRDGEWQNYWHDWLEWMRGIGWRRFGWYVWDQGPGLPGDWNGRLAPSFEFIFHFNRQPRKANKIVPCKWAGHVMHDEAGGMRDKDGTVGSWNHAGEGVQDMRIPDNVIRITRHKGRGIETEHPAVFPVNFVTFVMEAYSGEGDICFEPFSGSGTSIIAGQLKSRKVRAIELAPLYVEITLRRWCLLHPDMEPILDGDGRTYTEIANERRRPQSPA